MTRWGKEKTGKGLSVASRAKAYLPGSGMSYGVPDEALIHAWSEWLTEAMRHIDELEAELGGGKEETAEERVRAAVDMSEPPLQADLRAILAELDGLRAQRPVDIEAVLAPIQRVLSAYRTAPVYGMKYELLARHVVDDLGQALAEAEKIGRGGAE
jgi:hypothetical protein